MVAMIVQHINMMRTVKAHRCNWWAFSKLAVTRGSRVINQLQGRFHLVVSFPWFSVVREVHAIVTELQLVLGYPVFEFYSISSLRCHTCCFSVKIAKVDLKPLTEIICGNYPATCLEPSSKKMKPPLVGGFVSIPLGRSSNLFIRD